MADAPSRPVVATPDELAARRRGAARHARWRRASSERGRAALALTAGSIMEKVWAALVESGGAIARLGEGRRVLGRRAVRAARLPRPQRRAGRAAAVRRAHRSRQRRATRCPPADGDYGDDLDAAAAGYARTLQTRGGRPTTGDVPNFDVVLLGDRPGRPLLLAVPGPSERVATCPRRSSRCATRPSRRRCGCRCRFDALNTADEIWVVASGDGKADAAAAALGADADRAHVPVGGALGRKRTVWLLDADAASKLPG